MLKKSKELSYWLGVAQSDGHFRRHLQKNRKSPRYMIRLTVSEKSYPMFEKFRLISKDTFGTNVKKIKNKKGQYSMDTYVTRFLDELKGLDIKFKEGFVAPQWILKESDFFGSYLAGVIDGDGNIRVKRKKYPQCAIRIYSGKEEKILINNLKKFLNCSILSMKRQRKTYFRKENRYFNSTWFVIEFVVSKKNYHQINNYVLNNLALKYKRDILKDFISKKMIGEVV